MKDEFDRPDQQEEQIPGAEGQIAGPTEYAAEQGGTIDASIAQEVLPEEGTEEQWANEQEEESLDRTPEEILEEIPSTPIAEFMDREEYEAPRVYPENIRPKKRKTAKILSMVAIVVAAFLLGCLVGGYLIAPLLQGAAHETSGQQEEYAEEPSETAQPSAAPSFGGTAPAILSQENPVVDIAKTVGSSVVSIEIRTVTYAEGNAPTVKASSRGTGFIISEDGYILTNAHVVADGNEVVVTLADESQYTAAIKGADSTLDIALLKIDAKDLTPVAIGDSESVQTGEIAIAIGNPYGMGQSLTGTVTVGYISAAKREINFNSQIVEAIQTDAAINPGNSGGPLVNIKGEVIGITNMKTMLIGYDEYGNQINTEGLGFAVPINVAVKTAKEIIENGGVKKPGLGLLYNMVSERDADIWSVPQGAMIYSVMTGGPAEKAGLKKNDIILEIDGESTVEMEDISAVMGKKKIGDEVKMKIWRSGSEMEVTLTIEDISRLSSN